MRISPKKNRDEYGKKELALLGGAVHGLHLIANVFQTGLAFLSHLYGISDRRRIAMPPEISDDSLQGPTSCQVTEHLRSWGIP